MTHPNAVSATEVEAPGLAAIQHRYEQTKAAIHDPTHPLTEAIDVDAIKPPVPAGRPGRTHHAPWNGPRRWWRALRRTASNPFPPAVSRV